MKLLITGGCGFLGSNLAAHAINCGYDLTVFDNLMRLGSQNNLSWLKSLGKFNFIHGDIRNSNDVERIIKTVKPDVVFHLAGQVAMTTSIDNPRMDFEVNSGGTFNLLEAVRNYSQNTIIVYSSTNKVYGDLEWLDYEELPTRYTAKNYADGFPETIPLNFHSPYGCSKGAADQYMSDYSRMYGIRTVVFRHSSMYGGRQYATYDQGWIGWFCQQALETTKNPNHEILISGNGKQVRDVLHADDMVNLYFSVFPKIELVSGQVFNIGGGMENSLSLLELFDFLSQELSIKLNIRKQQPRSSDQKVFVADIGSANKKLGWIPKVTKSEGIKKMLLWVNQEFK